MIRSRGVIALILGLAGTAIAAFGYVQLQTQFTDGTPNGPLARPDATAIQFYINSQLVSGFTSNASGSSVTIIAPGSDPVAATRAALATWNAAGANIKFLPLQTTDKMHDSTDGTMVISLATTSADISFVGGAVAVTANAYASGSGQDPYNPNLTVVAGSIIDSDILLNPTITFSTDGSGSPTGIAKVNGSTMQDFEAVLTHELGHSLGANHSGILSDTMFQYAAINDRYPTQDDITYVKSVYPPSSGAGLGTISGTITASGGAPVAFGLLTMIDTQQNLTLGGLTNADGTYSVQVPPGNYVIYAEPANEIVQPANLYLTTAQQTQASAFETTFNGSATKTVNVTAGGTTPVSFQVNSGTTKLALPFFGFGVPGKKGDVQSFAQFAGPVPVASGQTLDLVIGGQGIDSKATFQVLDGGITASAPVQDSVSLNLSTGAVPLFRITLTIPATSTSLASSIVITEGSTVLSLSGILVVTPPTPAFTSASLVSAATYKNANGGAAVSPGGLTVLFGTNAATASSVLTINGGYDAYNHLPTTLGGVTVTFDGIPAPLVYVFVDPTKGQVNQLSMQVPFELAGKTSTKVVVNYNGAASPAAGVSVVPIQPAFFTLVADGLSDSIAVNKDGSINGNPATNAAYRKANVGDAIVIYGTGVGVTSLGASGYGLVTGVGAPGIPGGYNYGSVYTCTIGGSAANAAFGGWTPSAIGLAQWNVTVPQGVTGAVPVVCTDIASGVQTQTGTIYVN